jgi:poly-gamma-glutamate capsule biosynthesis protein CapA/YwtB (metallophosphatase superfamily)
MTSPRLPVISYALSFGLLAAAPASVRAQDAGPAPATVRDGFTLAVAGDLIGPEKPVLQFNDPSTLAVQRLISSADAAFANQEGAIFDTAHFPYYPAAENGGGTPVNDVAEAADLKALGFDLLSQANNHATDFGVEGMAATSKVLDEVGILHAGVGPSLAAARAPVYFKTPKGTVALIAAAGTFTEMSVAAPPTSEFRARPGVSPLRTRQVQIVSEADLAALRTVASDIGTRGVSATSAQITLGGRTFRAGPVPRLTYQLDAADRAAVIASVSEARKVADLVVFSVHAHETASDNPEDTRPADYLPPLFHDLIDAGADVVVRHGPHALLGIEIYKGRPIFYGMGSLFFEVGDKTHHFHGSIMPDTWYDSAIAVSEFQHGRLAVIRLYPFVQNEEDDRLKGTPKLPTHEEAQRILMRIRDASAQFGTDVRIEGDVGVVRVIAAAS